MAAFEGISKPITPPVFIIGVGRSGTSLLQSMLNAHSQITFLPETHFFRRFVASPAVRRKMETLGQAAIVHALDQDLDFVRAGIPAEALFLPNESRAELPEMVRLYDRLLRKYLEKEGGDIVGDKDPRNIDHLRALHTFYPTARVVHIVRDPRDVLLSRMKAAWSAHRPYWIHLLIYRAQLRKGRRLGRSLFGCSYLEIQYENLIRHPGQVLSMVCRHIGVDFELGMLEFSLAAKKLVDDREMSWKKEVLGPLNPENMAKWKKELSAWQVCLTERLCAEPFRDFDYRRAMLEESLSGFQRLILNLAPLAGSLFSLVYEWGRKYTDR